MEILSAVNDSKFTFILELLQNFKFVKTLPFPKTKHPTVRGCSEGRPERRIRRILNPRIPPALFR